MSEWQKIIAKIGVSGLIAKLVVHSLALGLLWWMFARLGIRWEYFVLALIARQWFAPWER